MTMPGLTPRSAQTPRNANEVAVQKVSEDLYRLEITRTTEFAQQYEFYFTARQLNQLIGSLMNAVEQ